jgi:colanic acid biosynthesis glycosyl transferase WcaI
MKVLVLQQHYWPEIAPTGQLMQDICEDLTRAGHSVTVVCGQPSYRIIDGMPTHAPANETHVGVVVRRVRSFIPGKASIPKRLLQYGSFFASSLLKAVSIDRPDVVLLMSSPPLLLGVSGTVLKLLRGVPFVYSVQDLYPDVAQHLGMLRPGYLLKAIEAVSSYLYRSAETVITLSDGMADRLRAKGVDTGRVHVVPNWADTSEIVVLPRDNDFAREHGLAEHFVVQYSGNVGLSQGLEHLIEAASLLRELPIKFLIAGDGAAKRGLLAEVERLGLTNVQFLPPQIRARLPQLLASCDVGVVIMKRGIGADLVPSKLYGIMAAGRPVLAAVEDSTEVSQVVRRVNCGLVVTPESGTTLAAGIRSLYESDTRAAMGSAGRAACERMYSRSSCTARYAELLEQAI